MTYYTMEHRGGLDEALKTKKKITIEEFNILLPNYHLYAFDERINCIRFLANNMEQYAVENKPEWLLIKISKYEIARLD